jgi:hypothetical protein
MNLIGKSIFFVAVIGVLMAGCCGEGVASEKYILSRGETVYVPVYSNVFSAPKQVPFYLAAILSIRNTDMANSLTVQSADYFDTKGKLLKRYYQKPLTLAPLETVYIYIPEDDVAGGVGANFIVKWKASQEVNMPIVECVMIGTKSGQGISFVSPGQVIKEYSK